ncbi:MAG: two-component system nitrogen regulation sensor histidine kinase NtrY [Flavobacteriaceae bacterium]|jgi:two-component system nitrogen regulation sensor histidine kinase NtrY|tara:strand:- start:13290 stop:14753 length:1464 start_codon:yes stop_codon:yes gene_type:complete
MNYPFKFPEKFSFRTRLFAVMIIMLFVAGLLILGATSIQYESQRENYHLGRLARKEAQIQRHLNYLVAKNDLYKKQDSVWEKFNTDFEQINKIHNVRYSLFSLDGTPLLMYHSPLEVIANNYQLDDSLLDLISKSETGNYLERYNSDIHKFHASYSILNDAFGNPYGILFFPYFEDISFSENELNFFLQNLYRIYVFLLVVVIFIAYFLSNFVTRSLETIRVRMSETGLEKKNKKIFLKNATREIDSLVNSYNSMIDDLSESVAKLAKKEREQAWQEMAKQVAHEIKNPLTPMRLTIQSFQHKYDPNDPDSKEKLSNFSKLLIQQIDTMSEVAEAFSNFASLPELNIKECDLVDVTKMAINIFQQDHLIFSSNKAHIYHQLDKTQWIRVITNLIHNALQSIPKKKTPQIGIQLISEPEQTFLSISDNGNGFPPSLNDKIFEPKFTTKTSGMGLGLGIVKNIIESHNGTISFVSKPKKGTTFTIILPR